jgi:hypothetical protein
LKIVGGFRYNSDITKEVKMSANVYTIENLLVGKTYYSRSTQSKIIHAEKDNRAVWYDGAESYLVELDNGKWRTVAVNVGG